MFQSDHLSIIIFLSTLGFNGKPINQYHWKCYNRKFPSCHCSTIQLVEYQIKSTNFSPSICNFTSIQSPFHLYFHWDHCLHVFSQEKRHQKLIRQRRTISITDSQPVHTSLIFCSMVYMNTVLPLIKDLP